MLSFHLRLGLASCQFHTVFLTSILYKFLICRVVGISQVASSGPYSVVTSLCAVAALVKASSFNDDGGHDICQIIMIKQWR